MRFMQGGQGYASLWIPDLKCGDLRSEKGHPHMDYLEKGCHQQ